MTHSELEKRRNRIMICFAIVTLLTFASLFVMSRMQSNLNLSAEQDSHRIKIDLNYTENSIINDKPNPLNLSSEHIELTGVSDNQKIIGYISTLSKNDLAVEFDLLLTADDWIEVASDSQHKNSIRCYSKAGQTLLVQYMDYAVEDYQSTATIQILEANRD